MTRKTPALAIHDMLKAIGDAQAIIDGMSMKEFVGSLAQKLATQKCIEIIGQAASTLTPEFKIQYPDVPWVGIINTRHRYVHEYHRVDFRIVWKVAKEELPKLREQLLPMMTELEKKS